MNPFGPPVPFPTTSNGQQYVEDSKPHVTNIIHATWVVVYCWPASEIQPQPREIIFEPPTKLEAVLFGCRCKAEVSDKLHPVKVHYRGKAEVQACELVNEEGQVAEALNRTTCACRATPFRDKFVALPINENILLHYQRLPNVVYTPDQPNTCMLLFKYLPSSLEIDEAVAGLDVSRRCGGYAFQIKEE